MGTGLVALLLHGPWTAAGVEPIAVTAGPTETFLTPGLRLETAPDGSHTVRAKTGVLGRIHRGTVAFSGGAVLTRSRTVGGDEVVWYDASGALAGRAIVPSSTKALAFGETLVTYTAAVHEPGVPYSLKLQGHRGEVRRERPGRTILDIVPLERDLLVTSVDTDSSGPVTVERIDGSGTVVREFVTRHATTRVAADGPVTAALSYDPGSATLRWHDASRDTSLRLALDGGFTEIALLGSSSDLLVWGPRNVARVDPVAGRTVWRETVVGSARLLGTRGAHVAIVDGGIALFAGEAAGDGWQISRIELDAATGRAAAPRLLHREAARPGAARRFVDAHGEQIVFRQHVYRRVPGGQR